MKLRMALLGLVTAAASCTQQVTDGHDDHREGAEAALNCEGPTIDSWYGDSLEFGVLGHPQAQINVLGNVSDPDGVVGLHYSLNGGGLVELPLGRGPVRLQNSGDFNASIERSMLQQGANSLELHAENGSGAGCTRTLAIDYDGSAVWPMPYSAAFDSVSSHQEISDVVLVVDGLWAPTADGLRTTEPGYDRLLAVGDQTWPAAYEVETSFTVHRFDSWGGIGLAHGWQGHEGTDDPPTDWPVAALGWVRNKSDGSTLEIRTFTDGTRGSTPATLDVGETYVFKMRSEHVRNEDPEAPPKLRVRVKVWPRSEPEPRSWLVTGEVPERSGSVFLVAHAADVTWHDIDVRPGDAGGGTPTDGGVPDGDEPSNTGSGGCAIAAAAGAHASQGMFALGLLLVAARRPRARRRRR